MKLTNRSMNTILCVTALSIDGSWIKISFTHIGELEKKIIEKANFFLRTKRLNQKIKKKDNGYELSIKTSEILDAHSGVYCMLKGKRYDFVDVSSVTTNTLLPREIMRVSYKDKIILLRLNHSPKKLILSYVNDYEGSGELSKEVLKQLHKEDKYIIFFEKRSMQYGESAHVIFEKYYKENPDFVFVLSKSHPEFSSLKIKYKDQLIEKGSKEFYNILANARLLVSSELPQHLFTDKMVDYEVLDFINKIPYIFLQHGVMYSKPILNPKFKSFKKSEFKANMKKVVVSSELEKTEFFKVGYEENDLMKTGLATYDIIEDKVKDKYVYMPTYRFWEEHKVYNGQVENTTYFKDISKVIECFCSLGISEKLYIVPHPKFAPYLKEYFKNEQCNFSENYTDLRDEILIYITDFSSASYDAHFRGAYIIYLWNRRKELELRYKAKSPLKKHNADGVAVESYDELKNEIRWAIDSDYKIDEYYQENFNNIVEFRDGKNSERIYNEIIQILKEIE